MKYWLGVVSAYFFIALAMLAMWMSHEKKEPKRAVPVIQSPPDRPAKNKKAARSWFDRPLTPFPIPERSAGRTPDKHSRVTWFRSAGHKGIRQSKQSIAALALLS